MLFGAKQVPWSAGEGNGEDEGMVLPRHGSYTSGDRGKHIHHQLHCRRTTREGDTLVTRIPGLRPLASILHLVWARPFLITYPTQQL